MGLEVASGGWPRAGEDTKVGAGEKRRGRIGIRSSLGAAAWAPPGMTPWAGRAQRGSRQRVTDGLDQLFRCERLPEHGHVPGYPRLRVEMLVGVPGHMQRPLVGVALEGALDELGAGHRRHHGVCDDEGEPTWRGGFQEGERGCAVDGERDGSILNGTPYNKRPFRVRWRLAMQACLLANLLFCSRIAGSQRAGDRLEPAIAFADWGLLLGTLLAAG
jgi:hypothetical protein